jgi:hypothetical protein
LGGTNDASQPADTVAVSDGSKKNVPAKTYTLFQAFPVRWKPSSDLAGSASEISIMELEIAFEYMSQTDLTTSTNAIATTPTTL